MVSGIDGNLIAPTITAGTPIILSAFAGLGFLFRWWLKRYEARQDARRTEAAAATADLLETIRHQVQNSHSSNLRDDLDEKFSALQETAIAARDFASEAAREAKRANNRLDRQGAEIGGLKKRLDDHIDG